MEQLYTIYSFKRRSLIKGSEKIKAFAIAKGTNKPTLTTLEGIKKLNATPEYRNKNKKL